MSNQLNNDNSTIESLIDTYGLSRLLEMIGNICNEKAEHIVSNWQDESLANCWNKAAQLLDKVSNKAIIKALGNPAKG